MAAEMPKVAAPEAQGAGADPTSGEAGADAVAPDAQSALWQGEALRLDLALVVAGLLGSRNQAAVSIAAGEVSVDGEVAKKANLRVRPGQQLRLARSSNFVGRGALKLEAALEGFGVDANGRLALDVGASTGGFTQVLLNAGAAEVIALDVGHDQLAPQLRRDPRVRVVEGCNARHLDAAMLNELSGAAWLPDLVVSDVSFISLTMLMPAFQRVSAPGADLIVLIKPQFEVGREVIGDGVVRDPKLHVFAMEAVVGSAIEAGMHPIALMPSPVAGGSGNREFLLHMVNEVDLNQSQWNERVWQVVEQGVGDEG